MRAKVEDKRRGKAVLPPLPNDLMNQTFVQIPEMGRTPTSPTDVVTIYTPDLGAQPISLGTISEIIARQTAGEVNMVHQQLAEALREQQKQNMQAGTIVYNDVNMNASTVPIVNSTTQPITVNLETWTAVDNIPGNDVMGFQVEPMSPSTMALNGLSAVLNDDFINELAAEDTMEEPGADGGNGDKGTGEGEGTGQTPSGEPPQEPPAGSGQEGEGTHEGNGGDEGNHDGSDQGDDDGGEDQPPEDEPTVFPEEVKVITALKEKLKDLYETGRHKPTRWGEGENERAFDEGDWAMHGGKFREVPGGTFLTDAPEYPVYGPGGHQQLNYDRMTAINRAVLPMGMERKTISGRTSDNYNDTVKRDPGGPYNCTHGCVHEDGTPEGFNSYDELLRHDHEYHREIMRAIVCPQCPDDDKTLVNIAKPNDLKQHLKTTTNHGSEWKKMKTKEREAEIQTIMTNKRLWKTVLVPNPKCLRDPHPRTERYRECEPLLHEPIDTRCYGKQEVDKRRSSARKNRPLEKKWNGRWQLAGRIIASEAGTRTARKADPGKKTDPMVLSSDPEREVTRRTRETGTPSPETAKRAQLSETPEKTSMEAEVGSDVDVDAPVLIKEEGDEERQSRKRKRSEDRRALIKERVHHVGTTTIGPSRRQDRQHGARKDRMASELVRDTNPLYNPVMPDKARLEAWLRDLTAKKLRLENPMRHTQLLRHLTGPSDVQPARKTYQNLQDAVEAVGKAAEEADIAYGELYREHENLKKATQDVNDELINVVQRLLDGRLGHTSPHDVQELQSRYDALVKKQQDDEEVMKQVDDMLEEAEANDKRQKMKIQELEANRQDAVLKMDRAIAENVANASTIQNLRVENDRLREIVRGCGAQLPGIAEVAQPRDVQAMELTEPAPTPFIERPAGMSIVAFMRHRAAERRQVREREERDRQAAIRLQAQTEAEEIRERERQEGQRELEEQRREEYRRRHPSEFPRETEETMDVGEALSPIPETSVPSTSQVSQPRSSNGGQSTSREGRRSRSRSASRSRSHSRSSHSRSGSDTEAY